MKKYYSTILILLLTALIAVGFRQSADSVNRTNAPQVLRNEKAIEQLKQDGSFDSLTEAFTAARYRIEQNGDTLMSENPANQMQAQFTESGVLQLSGAAQDSRWNSAWKLKSIGRGENQSAVGSGSWLLNENRAELRRGSIGLTEYFENRPDGLEQGFILSEKPAGDENLRLILQTSGGLQAAADVDGQKIILSDTTGAEVLAYEKLKVWDAENKDLTARMTTNETGEIMLEVEDANAAYPLTIDPTFVQRQKLTGVNGSAEDYFGTSVAISGDTVVIGAYGENIGADANQGSVYVFVRSGATWTVQAKLSAFDGGEDDNFGTSVAISGDTVIIGSPGDNIGFNTDQGSAYIFVRNGTAWSEQEKLVANDGAANDGFGKSVAISGDTAIVGAFDDIGSNADQGSAYIFIRTGSTWTQQAKLTANDGAAEDFFGASVAITSNIVIVGAAGDDIGANTNQGSAYIFVRSGTTWTQQSKLTANDGSGNDYFGNSVDITNTISGTLVVIGAWRDDIAANLGQGSAYIFTRSQIGSWSQTQKLTAANGHDNDGFGVKVSMVSITGSTIVIGAIFSNNQGAAYIFKRVNSVWTEQQRLTANDGASGDFFGGSVAISGETVIVGANYANIGSHIDEGSAYIFNLGGARPFDFDGDGKTDISIFRPSNGQWWINRSGDGATQAATFGNSTDRIMPADFTGDGRTDIALFRPESGSWFVLRSEDGSFYSFPFGTSTDLPTVGDFDGDGRQDAAVFRPSTATWYISQSSNGTLIQQFGANGDQPVPADYDGDGKSDIAIFRPSTGEWWRQNSSNGQVAAAQFGASTDKAVPGDYTGDGRSDLAFWRPSNGYWFILRSEDNSFFSFPFGAAGDTPVSGDYDGDGKWDAAVFRSSNTNWFINRSAAGVLITAFGSSGDRAVPNAFVP